MKRDNTRNTTKVYAGRLLTLNDEDSKLAASKAIIPELFAKVFITFDYPGRGAHNLVDPGQVQLAHASQGRRECALM